MLDLHCRLIFFLVISPKNFDTCWNIVTSSRYKVEVKQQLLICLLLTFPFQEAIETNRTYLAIVFGLLGNGKKSNGCINWRYGEHGKNIYEEQLFFKTVMALNSLETIFEIERELFLSHFKDQDGERTISNLFGRVCINL